MYGGKRIVWESSPGSHRIIIDGQDWTPYIRNINVNAGVGMKTMCTIEFMCEIEYHRDSEPLKSDAEMVADLSQLREDLSQDPQAEP